MIAIDHRRVGTEKNMKMIVYTIVPGIVGLVVGFIISNAMLGPMIAFVVPPELNVTVCIVSIDDTFRIMYTWAFFFAVMAVVTCWLYRRSWKELFIGLLITSTVVLGSLAIQRLQFALSTYTARQLTQSGQMSITINSLHLERTAIFGIVALVLSTAGAPMMRKYKAMASNERSSIAA